MNTLKKLSQNVPLNAIPLNILLLERSLVPMETVMPLLMETVLI